MIDAIKLFLLKSIIPNNLSRNNQAIIGNTDNVKMRIAALLIVAQNFMGIFSAPLTCLDKSSNKSSLPSYLLFHFL